MPSLRSDTPEYRLYKAYYKIILPDILTKIGFDVNAVNKQQVHDFHKRILGVKSIAGKDYDFLSTFLFRVVVFWAVERGIFIRTSRHQPPDIQYRSFFDEVRLDDGRIKQIIDLL